MTTPTEIKLANMATPTDVVSTVISRGLVDKVVLVPFVFAEDLPVGTAVKKARKDVELGAPETVTEAGNYTYEAAKSNFTQGSVSLTTGKSVIASRITAEAYQFSELTDQQVIDKQSRSLSRGLDAAIKALAAGFSQEIEIGGPMNAESLLEAVALISAGNAADDNSPLVAALTPTQVFQIQKQLIQSGASAWSNIQMLSLLQTLEQPNGYAGSLPGGVDVFRTNGMPTESTEVTAMVFNPALAFFGVYGPVQVHRTGMSSQGVYEEILSFIFNQVAEWNDAAGVGVTSISASA
jgi:hypothetical protein